MIYQPRNIQPSYKSVDADEFMFFYMTMSTTDYVEAYKMTIYNMDNTIYYTGQKTNFLDKLYNGDTGMLSLGVAIFENGKDYKWTTRLYQPKLDMNITYGSIIDPKTYIYTVGSSPLPVGNYYLNVNDSSYLFTTLSTLSSGHTLVFDSSNETTMQYKGSNNYDILMTTSIQTGNFAKLIPSLIGTKYTFLVGDEGLSAGNYLFEIGGTNYWFTTISDLTSGDKIEYDTSTQKLTQTHIQSVGNIVLTLQYLYGSMLNFTKSENTTMQVYINKNINIKDGMYLFIGDEQKEIASYNVTTGLAVLTEALEEVPSIGERYDIYSNFIETAPEQILHVRKNPTLTITKDFDTLNKKNAIFTGHYEQENGVPMTRYLYTLYLVTDLGREIVTSTDWIYRADMVFEYSAFKNGETYVLRLDCENEFGIETITEETFSVSYEELPYDEKISVRQTDEQGIEVSWLSKNIIPPYSLYTKNAEGHIQSDNNTTTSIWLEASQSISSNTTIIIGVIEASSTIKNYNKITGLATLNTPLTYIPSIGDYYYIYSEPDYGLKGVEIEDNTPYNGVRSAKIGDNLLVYEQESGMCIFPEDFRFTTQFRLNDKFFYNNENVYKNIVPIARYEGSDDSGLEDILLVARDYTFALLMPHSEDGSLVMGEVESIAEDKKSITISNIDVDIRNQKYLYLVEKNEYLYIKEYDDVTKTITFNKPLSELESPSIGDSFYLLDTIEAEYYTSSNDIFCLQNYPEADNYGDYIWIDDETWNDAKFWVEGGTPIERIKDIWWKIEATREGMIIRKGGV